MSFGSEYACERFLIELYGRIYSVVRMMKGVMLCPFIAMLYLSLSLLLSNPITQ